MPGADAGNWLSELSLGKEQGRMTWLCQWSPSSSITFSEHGVGLSAVPKYFECFHKHLSGDRDGKVLPKVLISIHSIHVEMSAIVPCACDLSIGALET